MIFVTVEHKGTVFPALYRNECIIPLKAFGLDYPTLADTARWITDEEHQRLLDDADGIPAEEVRFLPAIPAPAQEIIIMQNNFVLNDDPLPTYFYKKASIAYTDGDPVPSYPDHTAQLDYQAEICAVTKHDAYHIPLDEAEQHIFGYVLMNNIIAHDLTKRHRRPYIATSLDRWLLLGTMLVTPDELPEDVQLRSYVNNELRQCCALSGRKFGFPYAVHDLSKAGVLRGGSLISSGTPHGTALDLGKPWLKAGDNVVIEADGLGSLTNTIK